MNAATVHVRQVFKATDKTARSGRTVAAVSRREVSAIGHVGTVKRPNSSQPADSATNRNRRRTSASVTHHRGHVQDGLMDNGSHSNNGSRTIAIAATVPAKQVSCNRDTSPHNENNSD